MNVQQIAIIEAVREIEPAILDLVRMSHLVTEHVEGSLGVITKEGVHLLAADADAMLFGIYDVDQRIRRVRDAYMQAFEKAPTS